MYSVPVNDALGVIVTLRLVPSVNGDASVTRVVAADAKTIADAKRVALEPSPMFTVTLAPVL